MKKEKDKSGSQLLQILINCGIDSNYVYQYPTKLPAVISWEFHKVGEYIKDIYSYVIAYYFSRLGMGVLDKDIYLRPKDIITEFPHIPAITIKRKIKYLIEHGYLKKDNIKTNNTHLTLNINTLIDILKDYQKEIKNKQK